MQKASVKENEVKRDAENRARILKVHRITGKSVSYIEKVIRGDRKNEYVLETYMTILEQEQGLENELVKAAKKLVPFD